VKNLFFYFLFFAISALYAQQTSDSSVAAPNPQEVIQAESIAESEQLLPPQAPPSPLAKINSVLGGILFWDVGLGKVYVDEVDIQNQPVYNPDGSRSQKNVSLPFIPVWLLFGAVVFSFLFKFINLRGFLHAIQITRGKYDHDHHEGDISHFKALTSALSATIGLGNIAGVAIAIVLGGPGAVFWMIVTAFFGMTSQFVSSTLGQLYRQTNPDGTISGGPMYYLDLGFKEKGFPIFGKVLGVSYAFAVLFAAIGGGNMFQANQTVESFVTTFNLSGNVSAAIGVLMAVSVGAVTLGGIKRLGSTTSRVVPFMVLLYMSACFIVIVNNYSRIPEGLMLIFKMAFTQNAFFGGILGVMIQGIKRAAFSSEAGLGSSAIIHAAAKTDEPVREGLVAMLEPFLDTVVVCTMTALVIILSGAWNNPEFAGYNGVSLTAEAFRSTLPWFPYVLSICIALFAYSTMISWCYYGERGWIYLFDHFGYGIGHRTVVVFKLVFLAGILVGAIETFGTVIDFADLAILSIAFPNILGGILLFPVVKKRLDLYWAKVKAE
jgi:AGCS family alanine or glycine:cation symporter